MLKHSFHARLSLWHIALLVAVLALSYHLMDSSKNHPMDHSQALQTTSLPTKS